MESFLLLIDFGLLREKYIYKISSLALTSAEVDNVHEIVHCDDEMTQWLLLCEICLIAYRVIYSRRDQQVECRRMSRSISTVNLICSISDYTCWRGSHVENRSDQTPPTSEWVWESEIENDRGIGAHVYRFSGAHHCRFEIDVCTRSISPHRNHLQILHFAVDTPFTARQRKIRINRLAFECRVEL